MFIRRPDILWLPVRRLRLIPNYPKGPASCLYPRTSWKVDSRKSVYRSLHKCAEGPRCYIVTPALPLLVSVGEELLRHGSYGLWGHVVRLAFQGAALRMRDDVRKRLRRLPYPRKACPTIDHQRRHHD